MHIGHIQALLTAVEVGSYVRAAPLLFLSTGSAVSKQVRKLEVNVGVELVARKDGRVQLTPAGEEALPHLMSIAAGIHAIQAIRTRHAESVTASVPL